MLTGDRRGVVRAWDLAGHRVAKEFPPGTGASITALATTNDGSTAAIGLTYDAERWGNLPTVHRKPLAMVAHMRQVADGTLAPAEAVKAYHGALQKQGIKPARSVEDDLVITEAPLKAD